MVETLLYSNCDLSELICVDVRLQVRVRERGVYHNDRAALGGAPAQPWTQLLLI